MEKIYKVKRCYLTVLILSLVLLCGCFVMAGKYKAEESLEETQLIKILPGKTTKQEILEWFGPPVALARKGKLMKIPSPDPGKVGSDDIDSEILFELFSPRHKLTEKHIIYYYRSSALESTAGAILFVGSGTGKLAVDQLWILIDDKTGLVDDYIYRKQK